MKIVLVNSLFRTFGFGGAEVSVDLLAKGLVVSGHSVTVICLDGKRSSEEIFPDGVKVIRLHIPNLYWQYDAIKRSAAQRLVWHAIDNWNPSVFAKFRAILRDEKPDILHSNVLAGFSASVWSAAADLRVPIVHTLRDFYLTCARSTRYVSGKQCVETCLDCKIITATRLLTCRHVGAFVGISQFVLNEHARVIPASASRRVIFNPAFEELPVLQHRRASEGAPIRIGLIGRIAPEKGFVEFTQAFTQRPNLNVTLNIGGDGGTDLNNALQALAQSDTRILLRGRVAPAAFFSDIDVLVVPSRWHEPFGRIIAEAYAYGVPCLGRRVGGIPELIDEGLTGAVFDNDGECLKIIQQLCDAPDKRIRWREAALKKGRQFELAGITASYEQVYCSLLK